MLAKHAGAARLVCEGREIANSLDGQSRLGLLVEAGLARAHRLAGPSGQPVVESTWRHGRHGEVVGERARAGPARLERPEDALIEAMRLSLLLQQVVAARAGVRRRMVELEAVGVVGAD